MKNKCMFILEGREYGVRRLRFLSRTNWKKNGEGRYTGACVWAQVILHAKCCKKVDRHWVQWNISINFSLFSWLKAWILVNHHYIMLWGNICLNSLIYSRKYFESGQTVHLLMHFFISSQKRPPLNRNLVMTEYLGQCCLSKQYRSRSDCSLGAVWFGSVLFADLPVILTCLKIHLC